MKLIGDSPLCERGKAFDKKTEGLSDRTTDMFLTRKQRMCKQARPGGEEKGFVRDDLCCSNNLESSDMMIIRRPNLECFMNESLIQARLSKMDHPKREGLSMMAHLNFRAGHYSLFSPLLGVSWIFTHSFGILTRSVQANKR